MTSEAAWRYERKFTVEGMPSIEVESMLLRHAACRELFHRRFVNNVYFDGPEMSSLTDNVSGLSERLKTRIRWYGDFFGHIERPALERKLKRGLVGRKESHPLAALDWEPGADAARLSGLWERSALPDPLRIDLKRLGPVLANRYARRYFQSADGRFRFTVDNEIAFHPIRAFDNRFGQWRRHLGVVVELKYALPDDAAAGAITARLPFRLSRSSKYAAGLDSVHCLRIH